ncbi:serine/threonine protein kinase [Streptomyces sp. NBC_00006]|uniref:serine/threonine-protein kinase n=1 Tax=unclassified Streptomyces TaxID=2593676 RepID=UPI002257A21F|nr:MULTISPECIES: serine/threonine-protein kinase [unclassified Streptomyces]MCX5532541.1 serine/threonine protein kinase [Streptomyces sp. NBC_00006]
MGEVFAGRYELADPIGRGGVGAVWRAWDHRRRRYVAAKVLQQSDAHTLLRFVREQALRIDHPHVLAPASWAADDDKVLFTMDLVAGGSLVHLVADYGPLPPQFACLLLDQLLSGLTAVHAEGVVHRDIKPANLLLEATGTGLPHLRVSDFGIAMRKGEPRLTEADYVVGTPGYFAPEQEMGAEPDFPADLFAAGLVALYLLEGARPDSKALIEHFEEHGTPRAPQGVPGPLWGVLAGLLQPDPDARFRTATGARKALLAAAELLPEPGPDDELIEVFDQLGPLPPGFGPGGPAVRGRRARPVSGAGTPASETGLPAGGADGAGYGAAVHGAAGHGIGPSPYRAETSVHEQLTAGRDAHSSAHWTGSAGQGVGSVGQGAGSAGQGSGSAGQRAGSVGQGSGSAGQGAGTGPSVPHVPQVPHVPPPPTNTPLPPRPSAPPEALASPTPSAPPAPAVPPAPRIPPVPEMPPEPPTGLTPPPISRAMPPSTHTSPPAGPRPPATHAPPPVEPTPPPLTPEPTPAPEPVLDEPTPDPAPEPAAEPSLLAPHPSAPSPLDPPQAHHSLYASGDGEVPRPRPGPPARVTIPVLLLALACFAVGIWALTRP